MTFDVSVGAIKRLAIGLQPQFCPAISNSLGNTKLGGL
jgi:hypothetical protein